MQGRTRYRYCYCYCYCYLIRPGNSPEPSTLRRRKNVPVAVTATGPEKRHHGATLRRRKNVPASVTASEPEKHHHSPALRRRSPPLPQPGRGTAPNRGSADTPEPSSPPDMHHSQTAARQVVSTHLLKAKGNSADMQEPGRGPQDAQRQTVA